MKEKKNHQSKKEELVNPFKQIFIEKKKVSNFLLSIDIKITSNI